MYGMMAALPNRGDVDQIVLNVLDGLSRVALKGLSQALAVE